MNNRDQNEKVDKKKETEEYVATYLAKLRSIPDTPEGNLEVSRLIFQSLEDGEKKALARMDAADLAKKNVVESKKTLEI